MAANFSTITVDFCIPLTNSAAIHFCDCTELSKQISLSYSHQYRTHTYFHTHIYMRPMCGLDFAGTNIDHIFQRPKTTVASNSLLHIEFDYRVLSFWIRWEENIGTEPFVIHEETELQRKKKESNYVWIRMRRVHTSEPKGWNFHRTLNFIIFHAHNILRRVKPRYAAMAKDTCREVVISTFSPQKKWDGVSTFVGWQRKNWSKSITYQQFDTKTMLNIFVTLCMIAWFLPQDFAKLTYFMS